MSEFYKVEKIDGKGFGCISLKKLKPGTLILTGRPDVIAKGVDRFSAPSKAVIESLMFSFKNLSKDDQQEYLSLHNQWDDKMMERADDLLSNGGLFGMNPEKKQMALKIFCIYKTNSHEDGLSIKVSRLNHSCCANASYVWDEENQCYEIRTVSKIEIGEEISINYTPRSLFMKNFQTRQKFLWMAWGFKCTCTICLDESQNNANDDYERFAKLLKEFPPDLTGDPQNFVSFEHTQKSISAMKEMYNLAKEKKGARTKLYRIAEDGLFAATVGYIYAKKAKNVPLIEEFQKEAKNFAQADAKIRKIVNGSLCNEDVKRSENCKEWLDEQYRNNIFLLQFNRMFM